MEPTGLSNLANPDRLRALYRLSLLDSPPDPAFDRLTWLASQILKAPASTVTLVDLDHQFYKSFVGMAEPWATLRQSDLNHSFCQYIVETGEPLIVDDARTDDLLKDNLAIRDMNVIAYAGVPLRTSRNMILGSFCVIDRQPRHWTDADIEILKALAQSVMTEIELRSEIIEREHLQEAMEFTYRELEDALAMANESSALKSQFISMASHEFRTPLSVINLSSLMLYKTTDTPTDDKRAQHYERIQHAISKMIGLIDNVLSVGKSEAGKTPFAPRCVDVESLCADVIESVRATDSKGQPITFRRYGIASETWIDPDQFQAILHNLLVNAAKYSPRASPIEVELTYSDANLTLNVIDHGIGIPTADQAHLFEPFYRAKNVGGIQGTGLGLVIVKRAVELHGGTIDVRSTSGNGTTFIVTLPLGAHNPA